MNVIDIVLLIGMAACAGWGAKKGFVRMLMITAGLIAAIILAVHYNDGFTQELASYFAASPIWTAMFAFLISSMLLFALFRMAAKLFYRVANLQELGRRDQFGGALMGLVFGWILMGYVVFLGMFLPLPYTLEPKIEQSALALPMGSSVPFVYESSSRLHPSETNFMLKMESSLASAVDLSKNRANGRRKLSNVDRARVADFLDRIERYFVSST
ncbi:MAG: hypothetical protein Kow0074_15290 [Candidatus Zixiibacteriota bacterium]